VCQFSQLIPLVVLTISIAAQQHKRRQKFNMTRCSYCKTIEARRALGCAPFRCSAALSWVLQVAVINVSPMAVLERARRDLHAKQRALRYAAPVGDFTLPLSSPPSELFHV
jgi:hypothetical protein